MINYHVADFIIRIKNASHARRQEVRMPFSNMSKAIAETLVKEGFLASVKEEMVENKKEIIATLRFVNRRPVVEGVKVISKPSLRTYTTHKGMRQQHNRSLVSIISTSQGVMSGREAGKKGVGGELLFQIW